MLGAFSMTQMTDPSAALESFQEALNANGADELGRSTIDPQLYAYSDRPNGIPRITFVRLDDSTVTALVMFVLVDQREDGPRYQIGYAVPEKYRSQGRAKEIVTAAIAELKRGLSKNGVTGFSVEAIVGKDNEPSMRVAATTLSTSPTEIIDSVSGLPALHYVRNV